MRDHKVKFIPVTGLDRNLDYNNAVKSAIEADDRGLCMRLQSHDLDSDDLAQQLDSALTALGVGTNKVDLLVDYGAVVLPRSVVVPLIAAIPHLKAWRSVTFAACSFPVDMSKIAKYSIAELPRDEWANWNHLRLNASRIGRVPTFSDYGINYPEALEIDPRQMRMSANIRYTWTTTYVVARGEVFPRKKDKDEKAPPATQYPQLAKAIMDHQAWCGPKFSWGDEYIQKCANKECVGGGREWRAVGTSHHLAFVVKQIANLP